MRRISLYAVVLILVMCWCLSTFAGGSFALKGGKTTGSIISGIESQKFVVEFITPQVTGVQTQSINSDWSKEISQIQQQIQLSRPSSVFVQSVENPLEFHQVFSGVAMNIPGDALEKIQELPFVKKIYPDKEIEMCLTESLLQIKANKAQEMTDQNFRLLEGKGVKIAILDTGVDYTHPMFGSGVFPGGRFSGGYDFVNQDSDPMDDHGHGTHCAGIIGGRSNVLTGIAPGCEFLVYKVLDSKGKGSVSSVLSALEAAVKNNAKIISLSLGIPYDQIPSEDPLQIACKNAVELGCIVIAAAGNSGDEKGFYGNGFGTVWSPGCAEGIIAVGSVNRMDEVSSFSSKGPGINGVNKPDIYAPGENILSSWLVNQGEYRKLFGTSIAAPHVSGACALILQKYGVLTSVQVRDILNSGSDWLKDENKDSSGRLNVFKSVSIPVLLSPASAGMGVIEPGTQRSLEKTFLLKNNTDQIQVFGNRIETDFVKGIQWSVSPSEMILEPGAEKNIRVDIVADSSVEDVRIEARIIAESTSGFSVTGFTWAEIYGPGIWIKGNSIKQAVVFNEEGTYIYRKNPVTPLRLPTKTGKFSVICQLGMDQMIVRDNIWVDEENPVVSVDVSSQDASLHLQVVTEDSEGSILENVYSSWALIHRNTGNGMVLVKELITTLELSQISEEYRLELLSVYNYQGTPFVIQKIFAEKLDSDKEFTFILNQEKYLDFEFQYPVNSHDSIYLDCFPGTNGMSQLFLERTPEFLLNSNNQVRIYMDSETYQENFHQGLNLTLYNKDQEEYTSLLETPFVSLNDSHLTLIQGNFTVSQQNYLVNRKVTFGKGFPVFSSNIVIENQELTLQSGVFEKPGFYSQQADYLCGGKYRLLNGKNEILESGELSSTMKIPVEKGINRLIIEGFATLCSGFYGGEIQSFTTGIPEVILGFDSEKQNCTPPVLENLQIGSVTNGNVLSAYNSEGIFQVSFQKPEEIKVIRAFLRNGNFEKELPLQKNNANWECLNVGSKLQGIPYGFCDLKVYAEGFSGNFISYKIPQCIAFVPHRAGEYYLNGIKEGVSGKFIDEYPSFWGVLSAHYGLKGDLIEFNSEKLPELLPEYCVFIMRSNFSAPGKIEWFINNQSLGMISLRGESFVTSNEKIHVEFRNKGDYQGFCGEMRLKVPSYLLNPGTLQKIGIKIVDEGHFLGYLSSWETDRTPPEIELLAPQEKIWYTSLRNVEILGVATDLSEIEKIWVVTDSGREFPGEITSVIDNTCSFRVSGIQLNIQETSLQIFARDLYGNIGEYGLKCILTDIQKKQEILTFPEIQDECATCKYIKEQKIRIKSGLMPVYDYTMVPEGYFDFDLKKKNGVIAADTALDWNSGTLYNAVNRTDTDGDGLLECRYKIDFSGFLGHDYTQPEIDLLSADVDKAFDIWNQSLEHMGLEFKKVTDESATITVSTVNGTDYSAYASVFGGFYFTSNINFEFNYNRNYFGAHHQWLNSSKIKMKSPPGNPNVQVVSLFPLNDETSGYRRYTPIYIVALHEIGHLMGLIHTFDGVVKSSGGSGTEYLVDWLKYPVGTDFSAMQLSETYGGEHPKRTLSSRGYNNSFMTYDRPLNGLYWDILPQHKGYLAHYYQTVNPSGANELLAIGISEETSRQVFRHSGITLETEGNNTTSEANSIFIGQSILGSISSWDVNSNTQSETDGDPADWYTFEISSEFSRETFFFDVDYASKIFETRLDLYDSNGNTVETAVDSADYTAYTGLSYPDPGSIHDKEGMTTYNYPDPFLVFTAESQMGTFFLKVSKLTQGYFYQNNLHPNGDYFLITSGPAPTETLVLTCELSENGLVDTSDYVLSWTNSKFAVEYILEEDVEGDFLTPENTWMIPFAHTYTVLSRETGVYWYRVNGKNNMGETGWSAPISIEVSLLFPDDHLEIAVRKAINKPTGIIKPSDVAGLLTLEANSTIAEGQIVDLSGMEYCTSLTEVTFEGNAIVDLTPLSSTTTIAKLVISNNDIVDLTPIGNLASVSYLNISGNDITDLSPLQGITNCVYLDFSDNQLTSLNGLQTLVNIQFLSGVSNEISDIDGIGVISSAQWINLSQNLISDLNAFTAEKGNVTYLNLSGNSIENISDLVGLTNCVQLDLSENNIIDITVLEGFSALSDLDLSTNEVYSLEPLVNNTSFASGRTLTIFGNPLGSAARSEQMRTLVRRGVNVQYDNNPPSITLVSPVGGEKVPGITAEIQWSTMDLDSGISPEGESLEVEISYSPNSGISWEVIATGQEDSGLYIWDTAALTSGTTYRVKLLVWDGSLTAEDSSAGDFTIEVATINFEDLTVETVIRSLINRPSGDIYPSDVFTLETLDLSNTYATRLGGLENCKSLINIDVSGNSIESYNPISSLPKLYRITAMSCEISSLDIFAPVMSIEALHLDNNPLTDGAFAGISNFTNLKEIWVGSTEITTLTPLSSINSLQIIQANSTEVSDLSPLTTLTQIKDIYLISCEVTDLLPLVNNTGLGSGDSLWIYDNPLSTISRTTYVETLISRQVNVYYDSNPPDVSLQSLTGEETIYGPDLVAVNWIANDPNGETLSVKLYYSFDDGASWKDMAGPLPNTGSYDWDITYLTPAATYRVRAEAFNVSRSFTSDSENSFTIEIASLFETDNPLKTHMSATYGNIAGSVYPLHIENVLTIEASGMGIVSISDLNYAKLLQELTFERNSIVSLSSLSKETGIIHLNLATNEIVDISFLSNMLSMETLDLSGNHIKLINSLSGMTKMIHLNLSDNTIEVVSSLSGMSLLETLSLESNCINSLSGLNNLKNLRQIDLSDNEIVTINELSGLTRAVNILLSGNQITNISPLISNTGLGQGDFIDLRSNPLDNISRTIYIPQLLSREVNVLFENDPPTVNIVSPEDGKTYTVSPLGITWEATDPDGNSLEVNIAYKKGAGEWTDIATGEVNDGFFLWGVFTQENGTDYQLKVVVSDGILTAEDITTAFTIETDIGIPVLSGTTYSAIGNISLEWTMIPGGLTYELEKATDSGFTTPEVVYSGNLTGEVFTGETPGNYYFRVRAHTIPGTSEWSNTHGVEVPEPLPSKVLNGYAGKISGADISFNSFWGTQQSFYALKGQSVSFYTELVPEENFSEFTFVFRGSHSGDGRIDWYVNNQFAVTSYAIGETKEWTSGNSSLKFNYRGNFSGYSGEYWFTIPSSFITFGESTEIRADMIGSSWVLIQKNGSIVDSDSPSVFIKYPTEDPVYLTTEVVVNVKGIANDNSEIAGISWEASDGQKGVCNYTLNGVTYEWYTGNITLSPGTTEIEVFVSDIYGNQSKDELTIESTPDLTAPVVTIDIPIDLSTTYEAFVSVSGTITDASSIIAVTWENISTGQLGIVSSYSDTSFNFVAQPLIIGTNTIEVYAKDRYGNIGLNTVQIDRLVDIVPPQLTIECPVPVAGITFSSSQALLLFTGEVSDNVSLKEIRWLNTISGEVTDSGTLEVSGLNQNWEFSIPMMKDPGAVVHTNEVVITALDNQGNFSVPETIEVWFTPLADGTPPVISIEQPSADPNLTVYQGTVEISGSVSDQNPATVEAVFYEMSDGRNGQAILYNNFLNFRIEGVTLIEDSVLGITVTAIDKGANRTSDYLNVTWASKLDKFVLDGYFQFISGVALDYQSFWGTIPSFYALKGKELEFRTATLPGTTYESAVFIFRGTQSGNGDIEWWVDNQKVITTQATGVTQEWNDPVTNASMKFNYYGNYGGSCGEYWLTVPGSYLSLSNSAVIKAKMIGNSYILIQKTSGLADSNKPVVTIQSPTTENTYSVVTSNTINISGIIAETNEITGVTWENKATGANGVLTNENTFAIENISLIPGENPIWVYAADKFHNRGSDSIIVSYIVDLIKPQFSGMIYDPSGETTESSVISVTGNLTDNIEPVSLSWKIEQNSVIKSSGQLQDSFSPFTFEAQLELGHNLLTLTGYDSSGNFRIATHEITREADAEIPQFLSLGFSTDEVNEAILVVTGEVSDNGSLDRIVWYQENQMLPAGTGIVDSISGKSNSLFTFEAVLRPNLNNFTVEVYDSMNNFTVESFSFNFTKTDLIPPMIVAQAPAPGLMNSPISVNINEETVSVKVACRDNIGMIGIHWESSNGFSGEVSDFQPVLIGPDTFNLYEIPPTPVDKVNPTIFNVVAIDSSGNTRAISITLTYVVMKEKYVLNGYFSKILGTDITYQSYWGNQYSFYALKGQDLGFVTERVPTDEASTIDFVFRGTQSGGGEVKWYLNNMDINFPVITSQAVGESKSWTSADGKFILNFDYKGNFGGYCGEYRLTVKDPAKVGFGSSNLIGVKMVGDSYILIQKVGNLVDSVQPLVNILSPVLTGEYNTYSSKVVLTGESSDNDSVSKVIYKVLQTGITGECTGTLKWSSPDINLQNGQNEIIIIAKDPTGNAGESRIIVNKLLDTLSPEIFVISPPDTLTTNAIQISVGGYCTDNSGVAGITWETNFAESGGVYATGLNGLTAEFTSEVIPLHYGQNLVTVHCVDVFGNTNQKLLTITRETDTTPPVLTIVPASGTITETNTGSITITGQVYDDVGVDHIEWKQEKFSTILGSGTIEANVNWSLFRVLDQGDNDFTFIAYDVNGNSTEKNFLIQFTVVEDVEPPSIQITSPTTGATYSVYADHVNLAGTASDSAPGAIAIVNWATKDNQGATIESGTADGTVNWSVTNLPLLEGLNSISVEAIDTVGNRTSAAIEITYLTTMLNKTMNGYYQKTTGTDITYSSYWGSLPSFYALKGSEVSFQTPIIPDENVFNYSFVFRGSQSGNGKIEWYVNNNLIVSSYAIGTSTNWTSEAGSLNYSYKGYFGGHSGEYLLKVPVSAVTKNQRAVIKAKMIGDSWVLIQKSNNIVDLTPPVIQITSPTTQSSYSTIGNKISVSGVASDDRSVVKISWINSKTGNYGEAQGLSNFTISDIALVNGANIITVTAQDAFDNQTSASITINKENDTQVPIINITSPSNLPEYQAPTSQIDYTIGGTASDNAGISKISWITSSGASGDLLNPPSQGTWNWSFNTSLQYGSNGITVTVYDVSGLYTRDTIGITVPAAAADPTGPVVTLTYPSAGPNIVVYGNSVELRGTAVDAESAVSGISWENLTTNVSGVASGSTSWTISGINLDTGQTNEIDIQAMNPHGVKGNKLRVNVNYTEAPYQQELNGYSSFIQTTNGQSNYSYPSYWGNELSFYTLKNGYCRWYAQTRTVNSFYTVYVFRGIMASGSVIDFSLNNSPLLTFTNTGASRTVVNGESSLQFDYKGTYGGGSCGEFRLKVPSSIFNANQSVEIKAFVQYNSSSTWFLVQQKSGIAQ